jgi:hypothetical protein
MNPASLQLLLRSKRFPGGAVLVHRTTELPVKVSAPRAQESPKPMQNGWMSSYLRTLCGIYTLTERVPHAMGARQAVDDSRAMNVGLGAAAYTQRSR